MILLFTTICTYLKGDQNHNEFRKFEVLPEMSHACIIKPRNNKHFRNILSHIHAFLHLYKKKKEVKSKNKEISRICCWNSF